MFQKFLSLIHKASESPYRFLILLGVTFFVRVATFFVDYYYPDMIVSVLYRNGLNGGWELIQHKGLVYTWFLDLSFHLFGYSARSLHIMAFFLTYLEGLLVYRLARTLMYSKQVAYMGAFLFIVICSTALPEIIVPNGEQVYMLFFLGGFICFAKAYFDKKYLYYIGLGLNIWLAAKTKETGIWLPLTLCFYVYLDIMNKIFKTRKAVLLSILFACIIALFSIICIFSYAYAHPEIKSLQWIAKAWDYIRVYPLFNMVKWIAVIFLPFLHPLLFIFPLANLSSQIKDNNFNKRQIYLYSIVFCLLLSAFAGGTRLYQHYFFPLYPILSIFCAAFICHYAHKHQLLTKTIGNLTLLHMTIVFGLYLFWALMVNPLRSFYFTYPEFTPNSYSIFLYPDKMEREALAFLDQEKQKNPKLEIYIWPIGHVMGYFSKLPFKIGPYIDVADNRCLLYQPIAACAKERVQSFFDLNKKGDIFVEYRGILDDSTFSKNPLKAFFQKGMSSHQNLFDKTTEFGKQLELEMEHRGAKKILNIRNAMYLWQRP